MKRWMKKGIAAVLACSMLICNYGIGHAVGSRAGDGADGNTASLLTDVAVSAYSMLLENYDIGHTAGSRAEEGTDGDTASLLTDAVYDEAVALRDNIAFLENGHWRTEEDITAETNIVFMDAKGNKKVISNKDNNGEQMFDTVLPSISDTQYRLLKVLKDDKVSYIRPDGTFFGDELTYYDYAEVITNDFILVSDDGATYRAVNSKGEVTADNLKVADLSSRPVLPFYRRVFCDYPVVALYCDDKTVVFDEKGNVIKEYDENVKIWNRGNGYWWLIDETKVQVLDLKCRVVATLDAGVADLNKNYVEQGYIGVEKYVETEGWFRQLVSLETGEVVFSGWNRSFSSFFNEFSFEWSPSKISILNNTDGTVYIADLEEFVKELGAKEGYQSTSLYLSHIVNDSLLLECFCYGRSEDMCVFVLTQENGFAADSAKKVNGGFGGYSEDKKYFYTTTHYYEELPNGGGLLGHTIIQNLCTIEGELIRDFGENKIEIGRNCVISGQIDSDKLIFYAFSTGGEVYITEDGKISETFKYLRDRYGNFLIAQKGNLVEIRNSSGKLVYMNYMDEEAILEDRYGSTIVIKAISEDGYSSKIIIDVFSDYGYDCFSVKDQTSGKCYLYNREGEIIFGEDGAYSAIGMVNGSSSNYYYNNNPLSNGLCIIEKTEGDTKKYGAIVINGKKAEGFEEVIIGDVNGDTKINTSDALTVLKYVATLIDLDDNAKKLADVNGDTKVNTSDALDILKYVATLIDHFGAEAGA